MKKDFEQVAKLTRRYWWGFMREEDLIDGLRIYGYEYTPEFSAQVREYYGM